MGGASSDLGAMVLPSGGGAYPTDTGGGAYANSGTYQAPWAGFNAQYQAVPDYVSQSLAETGKGPWTGSQVKGLTPGGGLIGGTEAYKGDNEQKWIDSHIDEIVKAAEWKKQAANKLTSMGYYNTGPSGGGYAARDTWGGDVWKGSNGKYYWDKEGKLAIPDDVRQRLIGLK